MAYLTLLVCISRSNIDDTALTVDILNDQNISLQFLVCSMAVGIVAYSAYRISISVVSSIDGYFLMALQQFVPLFAFSLCVLVYYFSEVS